MTNVTKIHANRLSQALHELYRKAEKGEITYIEGLVQCELGEFVEWRLVQEGEKSYDQMHLINQLGYHDLIKRAIVEDICEITDED